MNLSAPIFNNWPEGLFDHRIVMTLLILVSAWAATTIWYLRLRLRFLESGMDVLHRKKDKYMNRSFRMTTALGEVTVLPPSLIPEIRNMTDLNLREAISSEFHSTLPGFEAFGVVKLPAHILQTVARKQLTQHTSGFSTVPCGVNKQDGGWLSSADTILEPLSSEAAYATDLIFGNPPGWQQIPLKDSMLDLIGRLSSRIFLGPDLCRNDAWLRITKQFTAISFAAAAKLNLFPSTLRPLINWLDPSCRQMRRFIYEANQILLPVFESRLKVREAAKIAGKPAPAFHDTIEWAEMESQGMPYDPVAFQFAISFVAIHTTHDLLGRTLILLAQHPDSIVALRQEMLHVLQAEGWSKTTLNHLKLLDSAMKEAQRIWPMTALTLHRVAIKNVTLSGGTYIRKGERTYTHCFNMMDPEVYPNPEKFDIHRFKRLREQSGGESKAQLVTATPEHLGFGYGVFACPGRFFASNEIKIALCHLLLKYDWKVSEESKPMIIGDSLHIDPATTIAFRRRKEEIDLECMHFDEGVAFA